MNTDADARLLRLAETISDRGTVSWDDVRSTAAELRPVVDGLERVQTLAAAFAAIQVPTNREESQRSAPRWGQLEILEPIGEGAFGEVFRARDPNLDREVALKLRHAGPGPADTAGRRLLDEARRLARIRHPNVVAVYGADLCDGRVGIWTELIDGPNLEQRLAADGPLGAGEAISIGLDLCRALAAVHAAGLVHGDIKTANVLRERGGRIVLGDLGSATEAGATPITGSPATLAPEVLAGGCATPSADLYSLGVLLFRLLTGRYPVGAAGSETGRSTLRDLRPDLPLELTNVVERAADPDLDRRFPSAGALERALAQVGEETTAPTGPDTRATRILRVRTIAVLAAAAIVVVVAGRAIRLASRPPEPTTPGVSVPTVASSPREDGAETVRATAEPAVAAVPVEAAAPSAPRALEVTAAMRRSGDDGDVELADGDRVRPGDRLSLEIEAAEPVHVWVVNEDLDGNVFLLFPIAGLDLDNPLTGGRRHRLPGRLDGAPQSWQVTSAGGRERFLVIASRRALPELERELAGLTAAHPQTGDLHRGVGGIAPAPLTVSCRLDALADRVAADHRGDGSIWMTRLELVNP